MFKVTVLVLNFREMGTCAMEIFGRT